MFSWLSLTSGLFDRLKINFLSSVQARQGPKSSAVFYDSLLTYSANIMTLEIAKPSSPATQFP
jgi:hypothetical protein